MTNIPFPEINASLNSVATVLLTMGFILIKLGKQKAHQYAMTGAFCVSVIFLICYVSSKIINKGMHTTFAGEGIWKSIYYFILITHIILAMAIVPLVLRTLYLAIKGNLENHRRWAKWTFPIWYYVSITGVMVYFFLYQWF